ncbi:hypothetical protein Cni_G02538 [Canna indica]|uniref:Uncharacterized protein n=1 Tax=Canna indica TaxID=4628 RepID=A0AAQ3JQ80_9LILI|nr:hypothetical protein Cni_G02538 [Canna indica]
MLPSCDRVSRSQNHRNINLKARLPFSLRRTLSHSHDSLRFVFRQLLTADRRPLIASCAAAGRLRPRLHPLAFLLVIDQTKENIEKKQALTYEEMEAEREEMSRAPLLAVASGPSTSTAVLPPPPAPEARGRRRPHGSNRGLNLLQCSEGGRWIGLELVQKLQAREKGNSKKKELGPVEKDETPSNATKQRVAAAKQYIENHYKEQMKSMRERKESWQNPSHNPPVDHVGKIPVIIRQLITLAIFQSYKHIHIHITHRSLEANLE